MGAGTKKVNNGDLGDRISELDENLKSYILERVPLQDAVRTSRLSKKWRFSWTRMRKLVFDKELLYSLGENGLCRVVDRVLLLHQGSLQEFVLHIPLDISPLELNMVGMFFTLSKKEVEKFEVRYDRYQRTLYGSYFKLPSYFFQCRGLSHLFLSAHEFKPPPDFQGFSNIVNLELDHVSVASCALATLISQSPRLQKLSLIGIMDSFSEPFDLCAPALKILEVKCCKAGMFILKEIPSLRVVSVQCLGYIKSENKKVCGSPTVLCSLAKSEELTVDLPLLQPVKGEWPENLDQGYESLAILNLGCVNISSRKDILFIFCLLRSSPNLKILNISIDYAIRTYCGSESDEAAAECFKAEGKKDNKFNNLRKVKITGVSGLKCEIMLVKVILSCCMFIEALVIEPSKRANLAEENQMAWAINGFCRPSTLVKVIYSKPKYS